MSIIVLITTPALNPYPYPNPNLKRNANRERNRTPKCIPLTLTMREASVWGDGGLFKFL